MQNNCQCRTCVTDLSCNFAGIPVLKNLSFDLMCRTFYAIIGPNGSGKTSLFRCLTGEIPYTGTIRFNKHKNAPKIGYVPQHIHIRKDNPMTVKDFICISDLFLPIWFPFFRKSVLIEHFQNALSAVQAQHLLHRKFVTLSGGEQKRVLLALALSKNPDVLLLDEPDSGVDKKGIQLFYDIISQIKSSYDTSILMSSHHFDFMHEYTDHLFLINNGNIHKNGHPKDILACTEFKEIFH